MNNQYVDPTTGLRFEAPDGQPPGDAKEVSKTANGAGTYGPAGPATDAEEVYRSYQALPTRERQRFWLILNDAEEGFSLASLRRLRQSLLDAGVNILDRERYDRAYDRIRGEGEQGASGSDRGARGEDPSPGDDDAGTAEGTGGRPRGRILGAPKGGSQS